MPAQFPLQTFKIDGPSAITSFQSISDRRSAADELSLSGMHGPPSQPYTHGNIHHPFPALDEIRPAPDLVEGHFLRRFIEKEGILTPEDLTQIFQHPSLKLHLAGFLHHGRDTYGVVPATFRPDALLDPEAPDTDYGLGKWLRDSMVAVHAKAAVGAPYLANATLKSFWHHHGEHDSFQRRHLALWHFRSREENRDLINSGAEFPLHVKYRVGSRGELLPLRDWRHWDGRQLDAWSQLPHATYRMANLAHDRAQAGRPWNSEVFDLRKLDPLTDAQIRQHNDEHVVIKLLKTMLSFPAEQIVHRGMWEDLAQVGGLHGILQALGMLEEAKRFHDRAGWDAIPVNGSTAFVEDRVNQEIERLGAVVCDRIPEWGIAEETSRRPHDTAMLMGLSLFGPSSRFLTEGRKASIINAAYRCMTPHGFIRFLHDAESGPDRYLGMNYSWDPDLGYDSRGEFAKLVPGYGPPPWTLGDAHLLLEFSNSFLHSNGTNLDALQRASRHLKRTISQITKESEELIVVGKGGRCYKTECGILPELRFRDTRTQKMVVGHNGGLIMAVAVLNCALPAYLDACMLYEKQRDSRLAA